MDSQLQDLMRAQNPDGGWSYGSGTSWTEPTCYALLALRACDWNVSEAHRAAEWLLKRQRNDGGWAPQAVVEQSTWVTSLALLALSDRQSDRTALHAGANWLEAQIGQPGSGLETLKIRLFGRNAAGVDPAGWSWFPGTASWVTPTAMAILALSRAARTDEQQRRIENGQSFLLSRRCADGGWNHGGTFFHSELASSYPETTGMALVGLQGIAAAALTKSLALAESALPQAESVEAASWIQIALQAHGQTSPASVNPQTCRTTVDLSMCLLAKAAQNGTNMFSLRRL